MINNNHNHYNHLSNHNNFSNLSNHRQYHSLAKLPSTINKRSHQHDY